MKKNIIFCIFILLILSGCEKYPRISYGHSNYRFDELNRVFFIEEEYILSDNNPYDKEETENGYDLILHFVLDGGD